MKIIKLTFSVLLLVFLVTKTVYSQSVCDSLSDLLQKEGMKGQYNKINELADSLVKICLLEKGENSIQYANALGTCSIALLGQNKTDESIKMLHEAENIVLKYYGAEHPDLGGIFSNLYSAYHQKGDFNTALQYIDKSLIHAEKTIGKNDFIYPNRLSKKAQVLLELGRNQDAINCAQEVVDIVNRTVGQDHYYSFAFVQNLGLIQVYAGQLQEATVTLNIALQKARKLVGENHLLYGVVTLNLGLAYTKLGKYITAKKYLLDAINIIENIKTITNQELHYKGVAFANLATIDLAIGLCDQALIDLNNAIIIYKKLYGNKHPDLITAYGNIGQIYYVKGETHKALPFLYLSMDLINSNPSWIRTDYSIFYNTLAKAYSSLGRDMQALQFIEKGEAMLKEFDKGKIDHLLLLNKADLLYKLNRKKEAEKVNLLALKNISESLGENHILYAGALLTISDLYKKEKKYVKALDYIEKAINIYNQTLGKEYPDYINALTRKGLVLIENKDFKDAKNILLTALNDRSKSIGEYHPNLIEVYKGLSKIERVRGNFQSALNYYIEARKIIYNQINNNFTVLSESGKSDFLESQKSCFSDFHSFIIANKLKSTHADTLICNDILAMKGSLLNNSKNVFESIKKSGDTLLFRDYENWKSLRQLIAKQQSLELTARHYDDLSLDSLIQVSNLLEEKLTINSSEFRNALTPVSWRDIHKGLKPNEAVVEFFTVDDQDKKDNPIYYAIVLRSDSDYPEVIPLFAENRLLSILNYDNSNVEDYLYWIYATGKSDTTTALYQLVWQPLESHLLNVKKVFYSPSGLLHRIAFAGIEKKKGISLLDLYDLNCINSGKDIVYRQNLSPASIKTALTIGGIKYQTDSLQMAQNKINNAEYYSYSPPVNDEVGDFAESDTRDSLFTDIDHSLTMARGNIDYLQGSLKEIQNISTLLGKKSINTMKWSGYEALEDNFKKCGQYYPSPDIIHLSTHGFFSQSKSINPLFDSYLAFAGVQDVYKGGKAMKDFEDGFLNAYEVVDINLSNTKLVVLSACETGLGEIKNGEGVYGLPRAFKLAGCDNVLMSLWKIPDQKTVEFMTAFYQNWLSVNNIHDAFLKTQREMKEKYKDQFYWAAFVLI